MRLPKVFSALACAIALGAVTASCGGASKAPPRAKPAAWTLGPAMSQRRSYTASALVGPSVYVAGGMVGDTGRRLRLVQRFDPARGTWTTLSPLPVGVRAGSAAALGRTIYVVGGTIPSGGGRQVFAYSVDRGTWRRLAPLPAPRDNGAAVALGGKIWYLGGLGLEQPKRDVFVYDPARNRWSAGPALPQALDALGAVVFRGRIWTVGGIDPSGERQRSVWVLDPGARRWRAGPRLPTGIELAGATVADGRVQAVWEHTFVVYDPRTGRWSRGPSPQVPRHALALFAVAGRLWAIGGCTVDLQDSQVVEERPLS